MWESRKTRIAWDTWDNTLDDRNRTPRTRRVSYGTRIYTTRSESDTRNVAFKQIQKLIKRKLLVVEYTERERESLLEQVCANESFPIAIDVRLEDSSMLSPTRNPSLWPLWA